MTVEPLSVRSSGHASNAFPFAWLVTPIGRAASARVLIAAIVVLGSGVAHAFNTGTVSLTDDAWNAVLYFDVSAARDQVAIEVVDADLNVSGAADSVTITVVSSGGDSELVILSETGPATGVFRGTLAFDTTGAVASGDGGLEVRNGDTVGATYQDAADVYGNAATATDSAFYWTNPRSGTLTSSETWTAAQSPYYLIGDVSVPSGMTLTLEAGTEVVVLATDNANLGQDPAHIEILVSGTFIARGTAAARVTLHSAAAVPAKGDWRGINSRYDGSRIEVSFADIWHTTYGLELQFGTQLLEVSDTTIKWSDRGIYASGTNGNNITVARTTFFDVAYPVRIQCGESGSYDRFCQWSLADLFIDTNASAPVTIWDGIKAIVYQSNRAPSTSRA